MILRIAVYLLCVVAVVAGLPAEVSGQDSKPANPLEDALVKAGDNRVQLEAALKDCPAEEKRGMEFLIVNMPDGDLTTLTAEFLLENSRYSHEAIHKAAWGKDIPEDVFLDSILPYANINERRDRWRKDFFDRFQPLVADAKTPSEAAAILNQKVFPILNVKYSTQRKKADQSPLESMESGLASCTGLSVLLVDVCRAVGVPARIVGTPLWSDRSGNHTWVEIWDNGWHFTGACEPTGNALNQGWFVERAATAQRDHRLHAIYAVTFRKNGHPFPMVWARNVDDVFAVNVTDRYTAKAPSIPENHSVVRFRAIQLSSGHRVTTELTVRDEAGQEVFSGSTNDERFDSNDHLTAYLPTGSKLTATAIAAGSKSESTFVVEAGQQLISMEVKSP
ncbi:MAG: transglutaminase domain-containing protein [Planctomyces sp.]|nr:transglutaminase domain-containing protein [Planctomyces sp.]